MGCPGIGPCLPFIEDLDLCCLVSGGIPDICLTDGTPVNPVIVDSAILAASQMLWAVTGRQFGCCQVTIRPCRRCPTACCIPGEGTLYGSFPWFPVHHADGTWTNMSCPCVDDDCSCVDLCQINLPTPVCSIEEVLIDGVVLDPTSYRVDEFRKLVFLPGSPAASGITCWPECNDLTKPTTEIGTWSVTLTYGRPVPEIVKLAAAEFACELVKDCVDRPCKLPRRVTSVQRQGVSVSFLDPGEFFLNGRTGLYLTDMAILMYNPNKLMQKAAVFSIDKSPEWRTTTWQAGDPTGPGCT